MASVMKDKSKECTLCENKGRYKVPGLLLCKTCYFTGRDKEAFALPKSKSVTPTRQIQETE